MADAGRIDGEALVAALRAQGADRINPVRFRFIEAMARRLVKQSGASREILERRLAELLADYEGRLRQGGHDGRQALDEPGEQGGGPLVALLDLIGRTAAEGSGASGPTTAIGRHDPVPGELKSITYFRDTWSKLSVDRQLAEALERAPENAGPLNSHHLVLQALRQMRDISPDYLKHFMSCVDALLWLEQADGGRTPGQKVASGGDAEKPRKPARRNAG